MYLLVELEIGSVLDFIINNILEIFDWLSRIEFMGTNLLRFSLTLLIIGTAVPILLSLTNFRINNTGSKSEKYYPKHAEGRSNPVSATRSERYK